MQFDAAAIFSGITTENSATKFSEIVKNSSYQNLRAVISVVDPFKPETPEEKEFRNKVLAFVLPFRLGQQAEADSKLTGNAFLEKYKDYKYMSNDCYTYIMKILTNNVEPGWAPKDGFTNLHPPRVVSTVGDYQKLPQKYKEKVWLTKTVYTKGDTLSFVPGDWVHADKSPFNPKHGHWGIFIPADAQASDRIIVNRANKLEVQTMDQFLKNTDKFEVQRLYGGVGYQEHFHASPQTTVNPDGKTTVSYTIHMRNIVAPAVIDTPTTGMEEGLMRK